MAQKKQTEAKETTAPVKEQAPAKSKSGSAAAKKTTAADTAAKHAATATKAKPAATPAAPAKTAPATADAAAKTAPAPKKAAAPKAAASAAPKKAATSKSASLTKVYGEIQASANKYFIQKGSVPEGQLELVPQKDKKDLKNRIPSYAGQFVTVLGEFASSKSGSTFTIHNIASHDEIARKAHELSHDNPAAVEDNWFKAENELLQ